MTWTSKSDPQNMEINVDVLAIDPDDRDSSRGDCCPCCRANASIADVGSMVVVVVAAEEMRIVKDIFLQFQKHDSEHEAPNNGNEEQEKHESVPHCGVFVMVREEGGVLVRLRIHKVEH